MLRKLLLTFLLPSAIALGGCATMQTPAASYGCQAADVATTAIAIHNGAIEANPVMGGILKSLGWPGFIAVKMLFAWVLVKETPKAPNVVAAANTATCAVAAHNLLVR